MQTPDLSDRRELFVDREIIEKLAGAGLKLHHPQRAGVAFRYSLPWEGAYSGHVSIFRDGDRYRMYYRGLADAHDRNGSVTGVAESEDGKTFERLKVGQFEVRGSAENNVVMVNGRDLYASNFAPFLDERPGVPKDERYKAVTRNYGWFEKDTRDDPMGLMVFASPDGLRWRKLREGPVLTKGAFDSLNVAFWSEHEGCYVCYFREFVGEIRSIARSRSEDFIHWEEPELMDFGDTPLEHLYTNGTKPYFRAPHLYLSIGARFWPGRQVLDAEEARRMGVDEDRWNDCSDVVLMSSRGGNRFDRTFMESFIRPGRDRGNWATRCNYPAYGMVQTGEDELSLYVDRHNAQADKHLERMTLRLDGFASLSAGYGGGEMISKPLHFDGRELEINYATSAAGSVRVELQDVEGRSLPGYTHADCAEIVGDEIGRVVTWKGGSDLGKFRKQPIRMRWILKDADVFSFRFRG